MAPPLQALISILLLTGSMLVMAASADLLEPPPSGCHFELVHIDAKGGFTKSELISRAMHRSNLRAEALSSASATMSYSQMDAEYYMELSFNGLPVSVIADTGSDLTWVPLEHCRSSLPLECDCQRCKEFMDNMKCGCTYRREYLEGSSATGYLVTGNINPAELHGGGQHLVDIVVGCTTYFSCSPKTRNDLCDLHKSSGVAGLGRGKMSLVKQLGFSKFSYCLTDYLNPQLKSPINFGGLASRPEKVNTTKLVMIHKYSSSSKYFVKMTRISMQGTDLLNYRYTDDHSDMFIDTGMAFTHLPEEAFSAVEKKVSDLLSKKDFVKKPSPKNEGFNCYKGTKLPKDMPEMVLHLDGADMHLPVESYMFSDEKNGEMCLAIMKHPTGNGVYSQTPVLGNFQQQNLSMLFDITRDPGELSFARVDCMQQVFK